MEIAKIGLKSSIWVFSRLI